MSQFLFANNAATTLAAGIADTDLSITVATGTGSLFPSPSTGQKFNVTLVRASDSAYEIVSVTARSSDTFTIVRAQESTTAIAFSLGDKVELRVTSAGLSSFTQPDMANSWTAQQTFKELKETTYTLGTSGSIALDPANGSIQSSTLSGNPTFTDSLEAGQTVVLMLNGGASYTVTWPTTTWCGAAGNTAPTLTANDTIVFWKVSTTLYGSHVGSYA